MASVGMEDKGLSVSSVGPGTSLLPSSLSSICPGLRTRQYPSLLTGHYLRCKDLGGCDTAESRGTQEFPQEDMGEVGDPGFVWWPREPVCFVGQFPCCPTTGNCPVCCSTYRAPEEEVLRLDSMTVPSPFPSSPWPFHHINSVLGIEMAEAWQGWVCWLC